MKIKSSFLTLFFITVAFCSKPTQDQKSVLDILCGFVSDTALLSTSPSSFKKMPYSIGKVKEINKTDSFWTFQFSSADSSSYTGTVDYAPNVNKGWVLWNLEIACDTADCPFDSLGSRLTDCLGKEISKYSDENERAVFWNLPNGYFLLIGQKPLDAKTVSITIRVNEEYD